MPNDRPLIVSALTYIGVEQRVLFLRYRKQVSESNTTMQGFRAWKHALRQQPRVSVPHGVLGLAGVPVFWAIASIPHMPPIVIVFLALLVILSALYGIADLAHRNPPLGPPPQALQAQAGAFVPDQGPMVTTTGRVLTDADVDAMSDQADREWEAGHHE
jgi:hypothetical protein